VYSFYHVGYFIVINFESVRDFTNKRSTIAYYYTRDC